MLKNKLFISFIPAILLNILILNAETITVNNVAELQTAINKAVAGDVLILKNGTYLNNTLNISASNIIVKSASPGGVFLNGTNKITIGGDRVTFTGFQFTSGNIGLNSILEVSGNHNTLSHLNFKGYHAKKYIVIKAGSQYNNILNCNIEQKPKDAEIGCTIQISTSPTVPGYHKIAYCTFLDFEGTGGDFGNEPIRIGLSTETLNKARIIVEFCYFNNTGLGDSESVSVKSQENIIRYCTFTNQQNAMLVFRNGSYNVAYSNFFIQAGGIRIKEADQVYCYNNYFEQAGIGSSSDAVKLDYVSPFLNKIHFYHNTFVQCGDIDLGGIGPQANYWVNNLFLKSAGNILSNPNNQTTFLGNVYEGNPGISLSAGMKKSDIKLSKNEDGYFSLSDSSAATSNAAIDFPPILSIPNIDIDASLLLDISGQKRPTAGNLKDVGCDEFGGGPIINKPLKRQDVGPIYLKNDLVSISMEKSSSDNNIIIYPNPVSSSLTVKITEQAEKLDVTFYDETGRQVGYFPQNNSTHSKDEFVYSVSNVPNGIYFINFKSGKYLKTLKLIVQH